MQTKKHKQRVPTKVGNRQHVIELNGKHYDALTGRLLQTDTPKPAAPAVAPMRRSVDGVVKPRHKVAAKAVHAKPAKSKTLMRTAVKKPSLAHRTSEHKADSPSKTIHKTHHIDGKRLHRAKNVPTSSLISRFGVPSPHDRAVATKHVDLPVKPAPPAAQPAAVSIPHYSSKQTARFQAQLEQATAHTERPVKKVRMHHRAAKKLHMSTRAFNASLVVAAFVILGGFIAYQNATVIAIRVAAARAGVSAHVPNYTPAGFAIRTHAAKPGELVIGYRSNSDNRAFTITQTASAWDSNTLLENFVATNPYQTINSKGRKIFLYDGNATWVDSGIWYRVEGNSVLSSEQLHNVIDSI